MNGGFSFEATATRERQGRLGPPPEAALARLMAMRDALGITRIADITGLDRLGIPVIQVTRPFSLSNAVSQGKGLTMTQAAISAMMEAAEAAFAERVERFDTVLASAGRLGVPAGRFENHLQEDAETGWRDREITWVLADDLLGGRRASVPLELVHTAYVLPPLPHDGVFAASTTGLAAGFEEADAVAHGILECIERDAIARALRTHGFFQNRRIDPDTIADPELRDLMAMLTAKGLLIGLWQAPSPTGIPVVWCHLLEDGPRESILLPQPADGSAAALDPASAVAHAICEAAQARLAAISGARDDLTRDHYPRYPDWRTIDAHRKLLRDGPRGIHFGALAGWPMDKAGDRLDMLLANLEASGIDAAYIVRVDTGPVDGLSVVRIVIPDLHPLTQG